MTIGYVATADELVERIAAFIPAHPEILTMNSAWDLFKIEGFDAAIKDLQPSLGQADWALHAAKFRFNATTSI